MKTVLLVSENEVHRKLYQRGLAKHFAVEFSAKAGVDAVVWDIPTIHSTIDVQWLETIDLPVVILTCEDGLPVSTRPNQRILTYPVDSDQIMHALADLGVKPDPEF